MEKPIKNNIDNLANKGMIPPYVNFIIKEGIKEFCVDRPEMNNFWRSLRKDPSKIIVGTQGSFKRGTSSFFPNNWEKSDIDLYIQLEFNTNFIYYSDYKKLKKYRKRFIDELKRVIIYNDSYDRHVNYIENFKIINKLYSIFKEKRPWDIKNVKRGNKTIKFEKDGYCFDVALFKKNFLVLDKEKILPNQEITNFLQFCFSKNQNVIFMKSKNEIIIKGVKLVFVKQFKEIESYPELNDLGVSYMNMKTKDYFSSYVIYLKNFIKLNKKNFYFEKNVLYRIKNNKKIELSKNVCMSKKNLFTSFEIESLLSNLEPSFFNLDLNDESIPTDKKINEINRFLNKIYWTSRKKYKSFKEINQIKYLYYSLPYHKLMKKINLLKYLVSLL